MAYVKDMPELCCLAGTREELIKQIMAQIDQADPSKPAKVMLVAEVAGAGKSALAHSTGHLGCPVYVSEPVHGSRRCRLYDNQMPSALLILTIK